MKITAWIEAMRLRTLPVSVSGVLAGCAFALCMGVFRPLPALVCLVFAVLAQIASNFANEYYDFKGGLDRKGREGPRRGVTEGDISPRAMKIATYAVLGAACAVGCSLMLWGGWWLLFVGVFIALGVLTYSTGPYPLSHHALGELSVIFFFGLIPVNFTYYLQAGCFDAMVALGSASIGLMGANVLIINNYRDAEDDALVGKHTMVVKLGRRFASTCYLFSGFVAVALMTGTWLQMRPAWWGVPVIYLCMHTALWVGMQHRRGARLNPLLGLTAMAMLFYSLGFLLAAASGRLAEAL